MKVRYHHSAANYEETTHIPVLLSLPGKLPEGATVKARALYPDLAPTVLDLEGMDVSAKMTGRSLLPLVRGEPDGAPRVVVTDGRGSRAVLDGSYRYVDKDGKAQTTIYADHDVVVAEELFDLDADPGERHNLARCEPDKLAEMQHLRDGAPRRSTRRSRRPARAAAGRSASTARRMAAEPRRPPRDARCRSGSQAADGRAASRAPSHDRRTARRRPHPDPAVPVGLAGGHRPAGAGARGSTLGFATPADADRRASISRRDARADAPVR